MHYSTIHTYNKLEVLHGVLHPKAHGNQFQKNQNQNQETQVLATRLWESRWPLQGHPPRQHRQVFFLVPF